MSKLTNHFIGTLHNLVRTPSVVGAERLFFRTLHKELQSLDISVTEYDGILLADGGKPSPYILSAHVDRHGLIATGPNEYQYAAFQVKYYVEQLGDSVSKRLIKSIENRFLNQHVFAYSPWSGSYIDSGIISSSKICHFRNTPIFTVDGITPQSPGTPIAFDDKLNRKNGWLSAQLDNVLGVSIILELYRKGYRGKAVFTSQEEAGLSWRYIQDYLDRDQLDMKQLLVLDTSPFDNKEEVEKIDIVMRHKDVYGQFNKELNEMIFKKCQDLNLKVVFKGEYIENINKKRPIETQLSIGRTELGRLIEGSQGRYSGTTLQIPTYGYHTTNETCTEKSVSAMLNLLEEILIKEVPSF